ncbi:MAG: hypothetical protein L3K04_03675 [Thermoplasmata archaeon]|nr:hypothetical protein [Thermoplasmata archaeon]MCI4337684.1 hypothetical protein [Thermoplasmata archaeon]MCI4341325.1 hypothetical protein [Thermoplasmata archaeon]
MARTSTLLAGLVVAAALVGGTAAWLLLAPSSHFSPGARSGCALIVLGTPDAVTNGSSPGYRIPVGSTGGGAIWSDFAFSVQDPRGNPIGITGSGWNLTIRNAAGTTIASYDIGAPNPSWVSGGAILLSTTETIDLAYPGNDSLSGDTIVLQWIGSSCTGSISATLP